jgi:hypothetical protein
MLSLRRIVIALSALMIAPALAADDSPQQAPLENCLEASNPTVDFGTVAIGEKATNHLFIYNFCSHSVPLKLILIKPPFSLEGKGLPESAPPLGFIALKLAFKPVIPSPGMAKVILVGDTRTRVVLTARLQGEVSRPPEVSMQAKPADNSPSRDSVRVDQTPKMGG